MAKYEKFGLKRSAWLLISTFFMILFLISVVGASVANDNATAINGRFGLSPYKMIKSEDASTSDTEYYKSDYYNSDGTYDHERMRANTERIALQTAVEGTVLLWNDNGALPLAHGTKVSLFGMGSNYAYAFTGIGSGQAEAHPKEPLRTALVNAGLDVNNSLVTAYFGLAAKYRKSTKETKPDELREFSTNEVPWFEIEKVVNDTLKIYNDTAIMTVSRYAGEFADILEYAGDKYVEENNILDLSLEEAEVLSELQKLKTAKKIKKIILLVNSSNAFQFSHIRNGYGIDACLWIGMGGDMAYRQIASTLTATGDYVLSGRLPDTFVYYNRKNPAYANYGSYTFTEISPDAPQGYLTNNINTINGKYVVYQEGIYVGYRYYETRYEDTVLNRGFASDKTGAGADGDEWNYSQEVAFPFGYGMSYTSFERGVPEFAFDKSGEKFTVTQHIENTGDKYAGKDVMQVYLQKPYTDYDRDPEHRIEKASVELVGFAKTERLEPLTGEQTLTVTVDMERFKTYDAYGSGTYILEEGDYYLAVGTDAHDALNNILAAKGKTIADGMDYNGKANYAFMYHVDKDDFEKYSVSSVDKDVKIENRFNDADINLYEGTKDQHITYLSRSDWKNTFPSAVKLKCVDPVMCKDLEYGHPVEVKDGDVMPITGTDTAPEGKLQLIMFTDLEFDDPKWQDLLNQVTVEEMQTLCSYGLCNMAGVPSVGTLGSFASDGPLCFNVANKKIGTAAVFPCPVVMAATFNAPLIERLGNAYGMEALHIEPEGDDPRYSIAYAPGCNIHRTAYTGRSYEYYSEDGELSAIMLSAQVKGMQNRGLIVVTKHFLLNEQESFRYGITTWANEQSIREIYARPFELAVYSGMNGIMSSFNRIGCTWAGAHKGLLTDLLRKEWGFTGIVESDSCGGNPKHMTDKYAKAEGIVAGNDLWMASDGAEDYFKDSADNATVMLAMRESVHRLLYAQLHSSAMNGIDSSTRIVKERVWWQNALIAFQVVSGVIFGVFVAITVYAYFRCSEAYVRVTERAAERKANRAASGGNGFWKKHRVWLIPLICVLGAGIVLTSVLVPIYGKKAPPPPVKHVCGHVCPVCGKCLDPECTDPVCADKCEGHVDYTLCPVCGLCADASCENPEHAQKCGDDKANSLVVEAEAPNVVRTGDAAVIESEELGLTYVGNMGWHPGNSMTFYVSADKATTASLSVTVSKRQISTVFTDLVGVKVNGITFTSHSTVPANSDGDSDNWNEYYTVILGCISLNAGRNSIELSTLTDGITNTYNFDKIELKSNDVLTAAFDDSHYCPICGKCLYSDCEICEDKCEPAETDTTFEIFGGAVFSPGVKGDPNWMMKDGRGVAIGNINFNTGAKVTWRVFSKRAGTVHMSLGITQRNNRIEISEFLSITLNGEKLNNDGSLKGTNVYPIPTEAWYNPYPVNLGCVNVVQGWNTFTFEVIAEQTRDYCPNLGKLTLAGDTELSAMVPEHEHETVHIPAKDSTCDEEGNIEYWRCSFCGELFADENATDPIELEDTIVARHKFAEAWTSDGSGHYHVCSVCGAHSETEAHDIVAIGERTEPTCTTVGKTAGEKCSVCGYVKTERADIPVSEHTRDLVHVPASSESLCAVPGHDEYWQCTNCNEVFTDEAGQNKTTIDEIYGNSDHECKACAVCGKCLDPDCTAPQCVQKCAGKDSHKIALNADNVTFTSGTTNAPPKFEGSMIGNVSTNKDATITFSVNAKVAGKAKLVVTTTRRSKQYNFAEVFDTTVNGKQFDTMAVITTTGNDDWWNLVEIDLGEIDLVAGVNRITFKVLTTSTQMTPNFGHIFVYTV